MKIITLFCCVLASFFPEYKGIESQLSSAQIQFKPTYKFHYYPNGKALSVICFEGKKELWIGFPAAGEDFVIPVKDFRLFVDSAYIIAPYENGKTWYKGFFKKELNASGGSTLIRKGIHKVYHKNGKRKAVVDYDLQVLSTHNAKGKLIVKARFDEMDVHGSPNLGRY